MKLGKTAIVKMEQEYRASHKAFGCITPFKKDGLWYLHKAKPVQLNHVAHGSNKIDDPALHQSLPFINASTW